MNGNLAPDNALLMNGAHRYPETHWHEIQRFVVGNEWDPKDLFNLADDVWEAWPYFTHGRPTEAARYRFHFGHLRSFLKPYVKWYCYQRLLGSTTRLYRPLARLSNALTRADTYLFEHGLSSLDDIASPLSFAALWKRIFSHQTMREHHSQAMPYAYKARHVVSGNICHCNSAHLNVFRQKLLMRSSGHGILPPTKVSSSLLL